MGIRLGTVNISSLPGFDKVYLGGNLVFSSETDALIAALQAAKCTMFISAPDAGGRNVPGVNSPLTSPMQDLINDNDATLNNFAGTTASGYDIVKELIPYDANRPLQPNQRVVDGIIDNGVNYENWFTGESDYVSFSSNGIQYLGSGAFNSAEMDFDLKGSTQYTAVLEVVNTTVPAGANFTVQIKGNFVSAGTDVSTVGKQRFLFTTDAIPSGLNSLYIRNSATTGQNVLVKFYIYEGDFVTGSPALPASGEYVNGNSKAIEITMLKSDGTDDFVAIGNNANIDPTGTQDFAVCGTLRTNPTLNSGWMFCKNLDNNISNVQIGLFFAGVSGGGSLRVGGVDITISDNTFDANTTHEILIIKIGSNIKLVVDGTNVINQSFTTSLVSRPNFRMFARSASSDGNTNAEFVNDLVGYLAFFYNGNNSLNESNINAACNLAKAPYF